MKLKAIYEEIINEGIKADIRDKKEIEKNLQNLKKTYDALKPDEKKFVDADSLFNPFSDTRILHGDFSAEIQSLIVGIDVDTGELLLVDRLKEKGVKIDAVVSHHPAGRAYARFFDVMDLQVDAFLQEGVPVSVAQNLLDARKEEVGRRVNAANYSRSVDAARLLNINFLCMHTPCDNLAHRYISDLVKREKPNTLGKILDILLSLPEYETAACGNNSPKIVIGNKQARAAHVYVDFTGGTEGPKEIYQKLSSCGVDTIIAMHQSEEHFKKCKEENINVIFASHIASDNLGVNLMLDHLESKGKLKIHEFSGFRRFKRSK
ncbi:MAG: NGG1p interacting factor NIF3 [Candidatus Omnitrophica bacterium]|nr:NGG1p interacting factor NIF3 [Candidatus Omnitrophota bacterium]